MEIKFLGLLFLGGVFFQNFSMEVRIETEEYKPFDNVHYLKRLEYQNGYSASQPGIITELLYPFSLEAQKKKFGDKPLPDKELEELIHETNATIFRLKNKTYERLPIFFMNRKAGYDNEELTVLFTGGGIWVNNESPLPKDSEALVMGATGLVSGDWWKYKIVRPNAASALTGVAVGGLIAGANYLKKQGHGNLAAFSATSFALLGGLTTLHQMKVFPFAVKKLWYFKGSVDLPLGVYEARCEEVQKLLEEHPLLGHKS